MIWLLFSLLLTVKNLQIQKAQLVFRTYEDFENIFDATNSFQRMFRSQWRTQGKSQGTTLTNWITVRVWQCSGGGAENASMTEYIRNTLVFLLSVCPSVNSRLPKLLGRFHPKSPHLVPEWSSCARMWINSLGYLMTSHRPCLRVATSALYGKTFYPIFFILKTWVQCIFSCS